MTVALTVLPPKRVTMSLPLLLTLMKTLLILLVILLPHPSLSWPSRRVTGFAKPKSGDERDCSIQQTGDTSADTNIDTDMGTDT